MHTHMIFCTCKNVRAPETGWGKRDFVTPGIWAVVVTAWDHVCRGVALGDSWIAPLDFVDAWVPALKAFSLIDEAQENRLSKTALETAVQGHSFEYSAFTLLSPSLFGRV